MDAGWAVVAGAAVALVGSFLGSVVAPWLNTRREEERARRELLWTEFRRLAAEIVDALAAVRSDKVASRPDDSAVRRFMVASTEFGMLLQPRDREVHRLIGWAGAHASHQDPRVSAAALSSLQIVLAEWFRGETAGDDTIDAATALFVEQLHSMGISTENVAGAS